MAALEEKGWYSEQRECLQKRHVGYYVSLGELRWLYQTLLNGITTGALTSDHPFCLPSPKGPESFIVYSSLLFSPSQVICIPAGLCGLFENHSLNLRCIVLVSSPPSNPPPLCLQLFHMQNYILHKCMQTPFPQQRNQFFESYLKKQVCLKWVALFLAGGRVCVIPSLLSNLVSVKVKSCFFFVEQEPGQTFSIIKSRRKQ